MATHDHSIRIGLPLARPLDSSPLPMAYRLFIWDLQSAGRAPETITYYRSHLRLFHGFASLEQLHTASTQEAKGLIQGWFASMRDRGCQPATIGAGWRAVRAYCNWLEQNEYVKESPARRVRAPRVPAKPQETYKQGEIKALLAQCPENTWWGARDRLLVHLACLCGLRRKEIARLDFADILLDRDLIAVVGKGEKWRVVPITTPSKSAFKNWFRYRTPDEPALLQSNRHRRMSASAVGQAMNHLCASAGITGKKGAHRGRHTFVTELLRSGADLWAVKEAAGHASITTTEGYARTLRSQEAVESLKGNKAMEGWFE